MAEVFAIMPVLEIITGSGLGSLLGMRHALEPDHIAAVSTLIHGERGTLKAAWLGACWGVGHTIALIVAGAVLMALRAEMPARASDAFELMVAVMLVALGVRAVYRAALQGGTGPTHLHHHGGIVHMHPGVPAHVHIGRWTLARRPLLIGAVHGLAGSGALTALVLAALPSTAARVTYMLLFGLGSTLGMSALSGLLGWPIGRLARYDGLSRGISVAVGCFSTLLGVWWGYPLVGRLFGT
jgi:High-affinity nickel-transport protein